MAGRGRGRGRGSNMSFSMEQLGLAPGDSLPGPVLQPPPLYPKMERRPLPLEKDPELEYLLTLKRDFVDFVRDSPAYICTPKPKTDIDRWSDSYQTKTPDLTDLSWKHFPAELRPQSTKRKSIAQQTVPSKKLKNTQDITNHLNELEKGEKDTDEEDEEEKEDGEDKDEDEEEMEEEDADEEMDDGTDYVNNYFDNGDGYLDEDDDMDDGPVY